MLLILFLQLVDEHSELSGRHHLVMKIFEG